MKKPPLLLEKLTAIDKKYDYGNAIFGLAESYRLAGNDEKHWKNMAKSSTPSTFLKLITTTPTFLIKAEKNRKLSTT